MQERESEEEFEILWRKNPKVNTLFSDGQKLFFGCCAFDFNRILDDDLAHDSRAASIMWHIISRCSRGLSLSVFSLLVLSL